MNLRFNWPLPKHSLVDSLGEVRVGAKTCMVVYAYGDVREALRGSPVLDREATAQLVRRLFPKDKVEPIGDGDLLFAYPADDEICAGCFGGVSIVAAREFGIDTPSTLEARFLQEGGKGRVYLHAMHNVVDWFAFALWTDGRLARSLSLSPDSGVLEDIGARLPFEEPYWAGEHPAVEDGEEYPFPFHPLELGEAALLEFFGYQIEGAVDSALISPESIPLVRYRRSRRWWRW